MLSWFALALMAAQTPDARLAALLENLKSPRVLNRIDAARALADLDLATQWPGEEDTSRYEPIGTSPQRVRMTEALFAAAKDPNLVVRNEAIRSLAVVLRPRQQGIHGPMGLKDADVGAVARLGPGVVLPLLDLLRTDPPRHSAAGRSTAQLFAFYVLERFRDRRILELLLKRIRHDDLDLFIGLMMYEAAEYDDPRVAPILIRRIREEIAEISVGAYYALEKMGARAVPALIDTMDHHSDPAYRIEAGRLLLHHRTSEVRAAFVRQLKDPDEEIRERAKIILEDWAKP